VTDGSATERIGDVARRLGVDPDTLRYYERTGVVPRTSRDARGPHVAAIASAD
jgi:MerR family regulatory protein